MLVNPISKINLGLHIVGKREDGYHNIETIFYPIPLSDTLEIQKLTFSNENYLLQTVGKRIAGNPNKNLVVKVFEAMQKEFNLPSLDIYLDKKIPSGAGLGGGSSDAAFMMKAINEEFQLGLSNQEMQRRIKQFGADCSFFIDCQPCYATGIGDQLTPISLSLKGWYIALIKPQDSVSTQEAYANITPHLSKIDLREAVQLPVNQWRNLITNDFEKNIFLNYPSIGAIKETLYDMGATYAAMSGSGSTVFGLFKRRQDNLSKIFSDCFCYHAMLLI